MTTMDIRPGMRLGNRFEIDSIAATGGMGIVFRGRDNQTGNPVALKIMRESGSREAEERFLREAQIMAECRHPNLAGYIAHGRTPSGGLFLAMEWINGENLAERIERQPLTTTEALLLVRVVAEALAVLHDRGIVHRDIKPSNLLLRNNDISQTTLLDFGLACGGVASWRVTRTGEVLGTLHYIAPEQARGDRQITASTDVYALGCVLYECLTGTPPFDDAHAGVLLARILTEDAPPLRQLRPDLPPELEHLLCRMLSRDTHVRPAHGAALGQLLGTLKLPPGNEDTTMPRPAMRFGPEQPLLSVVVAQLHHPVASSAAAPTVRLRAVAPRAPASLPGAGGAATDPAEQEAGGEPAHVESGTTEGRADLLIQQMLLAFDAEIAWLPDRTLCVMPARSHDHLLEQTEIAAHVALFIRTHWPHAAIALVTGQCVVEAQRWRSGETLARACVLLLQPRGAVWLDPVSAALLADRFEVRSDENHRTELVARASEEAPPRPFGAETLPLVGREQELQLLELSVAGCIEEETSRAVLVMGGAGIGKSRLRREFMTRLRARQDEIELLFCSGDVLAQGAAYHMLAQALRRWAGITAAMSEPEQDARFAERIGRHVDPDARAGVLAAMRQVCALALANDTRPQLRAARPEPVWLDDPIMAAWLELLRAETAVRPVVFVVDDLHHGDAATIRLLGTALRMLDECSFLVVAFSRPGIKELFPRLWEDRQLHEMRLGELGRRACERMIHSILDAATAQPQAGESLPASMRLCQQAGGNPRHLEALLVHELEAEEPAAAPPAALVALLQRSFLQLGPGLRRILRCASIFGPTFWRGGIRELIGNVFEPNQDLEQGLTQLGERGWIVTHHDSRYPGEIQYAFRQPLLPVAIDALLGEEERSSGHALAAGFLQRMGETDDLILARHLQQGGRLVEAALRYASAAAKALASGQAQDAHRHASAALSCSTVGSIVAHVRSIDAWALVRSHAPMRALAAASRSQRLAAPGSSDWYRAITAKLMASLTLGQQDLVERTLQELRQVVPGAQAGTAPLEASAWADVVTALNQGGSPPTPWSLAQPLRLDELSGGLFPLVVGWQHLLHPSDPWSKHAASATVCSTYATAQRPHFHAAAQILHARNAVSLGQQQQATITFQTALAALEQSQETFLAMASRACFALSIVETTSVIQEPAPTEEWIAPLLKANDPPDLFTVLAHFVLAETRRSVGAFDSAESAARRGMALADVPPFARLYGYTALAEIAYARGDFQATLAFVGQSLAIAAGGHGTLCEIRLQLLGARAELQLGNEAVARTQLNAAYQRLAAWARAIDDDEQRVRFFEAVPLHAQVCALRDSLAA